MSESSEIVRRLVEAGANYESIGQAVGRNRSLIRQVGIGSKPGNNLRDALAALESRLAGVAPERANVAARSAAVAPPSRRQTSRGALAKVRRPTTVAGRSWTASTVKKAGVKGGARGLGHPIADAAEAGRQLAVTVSVDRSLAVQAYGKKGRGRAGRGGSVDFRLGDAEDVWEAVQAAGGDVAAYVAGAMIEAGLVDSADQAFVRAHLVEIDLRTFD